MKNCLPEIRRKKLKAALKTKGFVNAMEASNGLSALIVENAKAADKEFDAMWLSSLCDSAWKGKPDNEIVDFSSRLSTIEEIFEVSSKPLIMDGDTGGQLMHFVEHVRTLERLGVSAIVIEDKRGLKQNSFLNTAKHELEDINVFCQKISNGKKAQFTEDFMIIARIESMIAGGTVEEALLRASKYVDAGADGIMIHSYKEDGADILEFVSKFRESYKETPLVLVPTSYSQFTEGQLKEAGVNIVIYANHFLRSAYKTMTAVAENILMDNRSSEVSKASCVSMSTILEVIDND